MSLDVVFVKAHLGDPGSGGTANAAVSDTRKQLSVSDMMDGSGRLVQDTALVWTVGEAEATETWAWFSYWTAAVGGSWLGNEDIANESVTLSTQKTIAAGTIKVTDLNTLEYMLRTEALGSRTMDRRTRGWRGLFRNVLSRKQRAKFAKQAPQKI